MQPNNKTSPTRATLRYGQREDSWTDDLPVCHLSGVGFSTNQIYREDGCRQEEHDFEDQSFHFRVDDICLYGVFDGHGGTKASHFAAQRLPAELLLGQLRECTSDDGIRDILNQSFMSVEKGFSDSIGDHLAEKANLLLHVPEGMNFYEASKQYPELFNRLEAIEADVGGGTTAVVALIINNRLYLSSIGCCRALVCHQDADGVLRVIQIGVDHHLDNEEELFRLSSLGLNVQKIKQSGTMGNHPYTRTIGDYNVKCGYKEIELLRSATSEPVISHPEIFGGIELDPSTSFLIMMSTGVYRSLEDATGTEHVNKDIASMVASEFTLQSTLNGVAQAVVDRIVRIHHDSYITSTDPNRRVACQKRDDMTLLIRNFNYTLSASPSSAGMTSPLTLPQNYGQNMKPPSVIIPPSSSLYSNTRLLNYPLLLLQSNIKGAISSLNESQTQTNTNQSTLTSTMSSEGSTQSEGGSLKILKGKVSGEILPLDKDGRIEAYVDFSDFYKAMEAFSESDLEAFNAEMELRPEYQSIPEDSELVLQARPTPQNTDGGKQAADVTVETKL